MPTSPARVSLLRYSPALVLFAIVIADSRQLTDADLWGHVLWGRELLANGSLPSTNPYSYSAPGYPWLRHEWLSEVMMAGMFDKFGPLGLKLLKFACSATIICFITTAESETAGSAVAQMLILLISALILKPALQFRPTMFDFVCVSATIALLARHQRRGAAPLWIAIPLVAIWSNLHGGFFVGVVAIGVYGGAFMVENLWSGRGLGRGLRILAIAAAAAASTLCTFLIPPARNTWYALIHSIANPMTHYSVTDWVPLIPSLTRASAGSVEQEYFVLVILFFAAAFITVALTPRGDDLPLMAVAAVMTVPAFVAVRNIPIAVIAIAPVFANHLGMLMKPRELSAAGASKAGTAPRVRLITEVMIAVAAIGFARLDGVLSPGINALGNPAAAVQFMKDHGLKGNVLAQYGWGQYVIWHDAPDVKVFVDSRFDLAYPPPVAWDWLQFASNLDGAPHTLAAYPHGFVLIEANLPAVKLMDAQPDWRLIYSDDTARLYARANSPAAHLNGVPIRGIEGPEFFP